MIFMEQKKNQLSKYLFYQSECNLAATNFLLSVRLKWHEFQPVSFTVLYSTIYVLTELNANDVSNISIDRQKMYT